MVAPLDNFHENSRSILERHREDLEKVTLLVVVDEDLLPLEDGEVFLHLQVDLAEAHSEVVVIGVGDFLQELDAASLHSLHGRDNIFGPHSDVLHTGATVVLAELGNLRLSNAVGGLVDGHLDLLIEVGHDDGAQRGELGVDHLVIDGPEAVEVEHLLVPGSHRLHLTVRLVSNAMVDVEELGDGENTVQGLAQRVIVVARHEHSSVAFTLHKGVDGVAVGLDAGDDDGAVVVSEGGGLLDTSGASGDSLVVDASSVVDSESDILDAVTVLGVVRSELGVVWGEWRREDVSDLVVADHV